jgi:Asp-tRNA(Asn)/Glu-tRNA(Gln) amidotransferase A subunit family amidase
VRDPHNAVLTRVEPAGEPRPGPLSGRTLLVKDLIDVAGVRTTYGSRIYADHVPKQTAPAVRRLLDAGAELVGKASLPEFAWNVTGQNPWYGTVENPVRPGRTTGGSSSGNAAALAAGLCDLGLGTDTGCSIRLPSACCGTPDANTWPLFFHEAARSHRETFPARADEYSDNVRTKLELAQDVEADDVAAAYRALEAWRRYEPEVDLFVSPCVAIELPPEDCDELAVRIPFTAFLRPVNLLGWAGLAIANMQLVAPDDEAVLAAGLAWEREYGPPTTGSAHWGP